MDTYTILNWKLLLNVLLNVSFKSEKKLGEKDNYLSIISIYLFYSFYRLQGKELLRVGMYKMWQISSVLMSYTELMK